ncbi:hypothetical protein K6T84_16915 [Mycolicibacter sp. MYC101]|nr:hypothetical protein [Mycolicibacter sp. MYC101]
MLNVHLESGGDVPGVINQRDEYVLTKDWPREHERLCLLEETVDALSITAIRAAGLSPGSRCLEIGGAMIRTCG